MKQAIFPASFDPITYGHIDLIERAAKLVDKLVVAIAINRSKTPFLSMSQKLKLTQEAITHVSNASVITFEGLLIELSQQQDIPVIIRGLRNTKDFEFELQLAMLNKKMHTALETLFLAPAEQYMHLSSSMVREIAAFNGPLNNFVPPCVLRELERHHHKKDPTC